MQLNTTEQKDRVLQGPCKKCGNLVKLKVGDMDMKQIKKSLDTDMGYSCPAGKHVEMVSALRHWDVESWEFIEEHVPTEEEFLSKLQADYDHVRDTDGMAGLIESFAYGMPFTNDGLNWAFTHSPKGTRWYYAHGK